MFRTRTYYTRLRRTRVRTIEQYRILFGFIATTQMVVRSFSGSI